MDNIYEIVRVELSFLSNGKVKYRVVGGTLDPLKRVEEILERLGLPITAHDLFENHFYLLELAGLREQIEEIKESGWCLLNT